ncbi:Tldc2 [Symbiodinium natans]|uniref:Tldc2 protein n=1 Tax=Symbiodinium natans TaxID=878477 RepID=A0A812QP90_9DINO|nr:Tldc2 [Symbiodinium natans]
MAKALEPPQAVQPGLVLHPSFNVTALAELEGSPYLLSADGKGAVCCWDVSPGTQITEPVHVLQAHSDAISQALLLRSSRIPEALEDLLWKGESEGSQAEADLSPKSKSTQAVSTAPSEAAGPVPLKAVPSMKKPKRRGLLQCCLCCCRGQSFKSGPHWLVATSSEDGHLVVWYFKPLPRKTPKAGEGIFEVTLISEWQSESAAKITSCLELHDGLLAVGFKQGCDVNLVDPCTATVCWVLYGHTAPITALAECADGRFVTGGADGAIRLWAKRTWSTAWPAQDSLRRAADPPADGTEPPLLPTEAWNELLGSETGKPGVCSMAFHAHTQQARRGEMAALFLRVLVQSGSNLIKAEALKKSQVYVACTVLDVADASQMSQETTAQTRSSRTGTWNESLTLSYRRSWIAGKQGLPECSWLDLEVMLGASRKKAPRTIARCSVPLEEVVRQLADAPSHELTPSARKLYSPLGQGPYEEVVDAELYVGFFEEAGDVLGVSVKSVHGLAVRFTQPIFVRATVRQSCAGAVQSLPAKVRDVTEVRSQTVNPWWDEILEFEIPVFVGDRHISHSPDYRLYFQVFCKERMNNEKLLAELFVPLADAIRADGQKAKSFELKPTEMLLNRGRKSSRSSAASGAGKEKPTLCLAFQAIVPCPKQIQCTVERLDSVKYAGTVDKNLQVRMCFVEGDPMLANPSVRTSSKQQTVKPVWKQRCVFDMPAGLLRSGFEPRPPSVRKGWVHDSREANQSSMAVCIDVCDRDAINGTDSFMCRGHVPLRTAWEAATKGRSLVSPQWVSLVPSAGARLQVGFSTNSSKDQLNVHILGAEKLPGRATSGLADPFCIVRLAFIGQLGEPTDQASVNLPFVTTPAGELRGGADSLFFQHEEVLELPGALAEGMVAARASWHYQVDLIDMKKQVVLCSGSISVLEMLDDICRTEGRCEVTRYTIREKLEESKSLLQKPSTPDPFADEERCGSVLRKIVLKQLDKPYKAALDQGEVDMSSVKPKRKQVGEAIGSALVTLGLRNNTERVDRGTDDMELHVRFQVVSRWKGLARGSRSPPSVPMQAPSAVRCIATLANSIVAGYEDGNVFIWDASGHGGPLHQFQAHAVPVSAIAVLPPLGCVVTAGEVRNGLEAFSESRIRLWSTVTLELRQSVSLNGSVARVLRPLVLGAAIEDIMRAAEAAGRSIEKREKVVPPCLAVGTDSRQAKQVRLMRISLDVRKKK